jgi:hypothetical protein
VGAIVRAFPKDAAGDAVPGLTQIRHVTASDSRGARSSLFQTFGLGSDATSVDVEIVWPRAGTLEERTEHFADLAVDVVHTLREFGSGTAAPWTLRPTATQTLACGASVVAFVRGSGGFPESSICAVESGPEWAVLAAPTPCGLPIEFQAPTVQQDTQFDVVLAARNDDATDPTSRQTLTVNVLATPFVEQGVLRRRSRILLTGANFKRKGTSVFIDGIASPVVRVKRKQREADRDGTRLIAVIPRSMRSGFRERAHTLLVTDDTAQRSGAPFVLAADR